MTGSTTDTNVDVPRRVLIAEDEALIRLDLAEMLREEGTTSSVKPATGKRPSSWPSSTSPIW